MKSALLAAAASIVLWTSLGLLPPGLVSTPVSMATAAAQAADAP